MKMISILLLLLTVSCERPGPLEGALIKKDYDTFKKLLDGGADPNARTSKGVSIIAAAMNEGAVTFVDALIDHGADPNTEMPEGGTLLIMASKKGYISIVIQLLDHGAKIDVRDDHGASALDYAIRNEHQEVAKILMKQAADSSHNKKDN